MEKPDDSKKNEPKKEQNREKSDANPVYDRPENEDDDGYDSWSDRRNPERSRSSSAILGTRTRFSAIQIMIWRGVCGAQAPLLHCLSRRQVRQ